MEKVSRTDTSIRNVLWGIISKIVNLILPFIFRTILIYTLGEKYLGINSLFTSILQVLSLSELGFGTAIVFNMYKPIAENDKQKVNSLLKLYSDIYKIIGTIILVVGLLILPFIPKLISGSYPNDINIYIVYLFFLINTSISYFMFAYRGALLNANKRNDLENKSLTISILVKYVVSCILLLLFKDYYYYLIILLVATVLNNLINYYYSKKCFPEYKCEGKLTKKEKREIIKNVGALTCHKIGSTVLNSVDNIIISAFLGLSILAKYTNYHYIITAVESFVMIIFSSITSIVGTTIIRENKEKNQDIFNKIFYLNYMIVCFCCAILCCLFQNFIELWIGKQYLFSIPMMLLFVSYFFVHCIRRTIIMYRDATGMWWDNKFQPLVSASVNLILNIVLLNYIGIYGIIISTLIAMIFVDIPWETLVFLKKNLNIDPKEYFKKILKFLFITITVCVIAYLTCSLINVDNNMLTFIIKIPMSVIITGIVMYLINFKNNYFKYYYQLFKTKILIKILNKLHLIKTII